MHVNFRSGTTSNSLGKRNLNGVEEVCGTAICIRWWRRHGRESYQHQAWQESQDCSFADSYSVYSEDSLPFALLFRWPSVLKTVDLLLRVAKLVGRKRLMTTVLSIDRWSCFLRKNWKKKHSLCCEVDKGGLSWEKLTSYVSRDKKLFRLPGLSHPLVIPSRKADVHGIDLVLTKLN